MKRIINFLKQDVPGLKKFDLKRKFPGYFNIKIFRLFFLFILLLLVSDFYFNDWHFQSLELECPSYARSVCPNPVYMCEEGEWQGCNQELPGWACPDGVCHMKTLPIGFKVGRTDPLAKYGVLLIILILLFAFVVNHLLYVLKTGNWWYKIK